MLVDIQYSHVLDSVIIELQEPILFAFKGKWITIPEGMCSDGCSCPKFLWGYVDVFKYLFAWIIHDAGYDLKFGTRLEIDQLLYRMLIVNGMNRLKALTIYYACRIFGGSHW